LAPSSSDATLEDDEAATREAAAKAVKAMGERAAEEVAAKEAVKVARKAAKAEQKAAKAEQKAAKAVGGDGASGKEKKRKLGSPLHVSGESTSSSGGAEGVVSGGSVKRQRVPAPDENAKAVDGKSHSTFGECLRRAEKMSKSKEWVDAVHQVSLHAKKVECRVHQSDLVKRNLKRFRQLLVSLSSWEETRTDPIVKAMFADFPGLTSAPPS
jgi:hypothetical protein